MPGEQRRHHWYEYRVGRSFEWLDACLRTVFAFVVGLLLPVGVGILTVIGVGETPLGVQAVGEGEVPLRDVLSYFVFAMMAIALALGFLFALAWSGLSCLREVLVSRTLATRVADGVPRRAVPSPSQVAAVVSTFWGPTGCLTAGVWVFGLLGALGLVVVLFDGGAVGVMIGLGPALVAAAMYAAIALLRRISRRGQEQRRRTIASHWTARDERLAWESARELDRAARAEGEPAGAGRDRRTRVSRIVLTVSGLMASWAVLIFMVLMLMRGQTSALREQPRITYSPEVEGYLDMAFAVVGVLALLVLLTCVGGVLLEGAGRLAERTSLRRALDDPQAPRPSSALLKDFSTSRDVGIAMSLSFASGVGFVTGGAVFGLGVVDSGLVEHSGALYGWLRAPAIVMVAVSLVLVIVAVGWNRAVNVRDLDLRNELMERWPALPQVPRKVDDKREDPRTTALRGPILTPASEEDEPPQGPSG